MPDENTDRLLPDREHYRELPRQVREVARLARYPLPAGSYSALPRASSTEPATLAGTIARDGAGAHGGPLGQYGAEPQPAPFVCPFKQRSGPGLCNYP
jgi:hypothetical protein